MDKIVYSVRLDVQKSQLQATLHGLRVGDTASRQIQITLHQSGKTINLGEFDDAIMFVLKSGETTPTRKACTIEDNTIIYNLLQSDVSTEGEVEFTIRVQSGNSIAYAPKFNAIVLDPNCNTSTTPGSDEYTLLDTLTSRVEYLEETQPTIVANQVASYVTAHAAELKGDKGDDGDSGVITSTTEPTYQANKIWFNPNGIVSNDEVKYAELQILGWTVPDAMRTKNTIKNGKFYQNVERTDFEYGNYKTYGSGKVFEVEIYGRTFGNIEVFLEGYETVTDSVISAHTKDKCIAKGTAEVSIAPDLPSLTKTVPVLRVINNSCTSYSEFIQELKGKFAYYEADHVSPVSIANDKGIFDKAEYATYGRVGALNTAMLRNIVYRDTAPTVGSYISSYPKGTLIIVPNVGLYCVGDELRVVKILEV